MSDVSSNNETPHQGGPQKGPHLNVTPLNDVPSICFVTTYIYPLLFETDHKVVGGAEVAQYNIANGLLRRGHRVSFVTGDFGQKEIEYWKGSPVYRTKRMTGTLTPLWNVHPNGTSILQALKSASADIYFQRGLSHLTGFVGIHRRLNDCKFVYSVASLQDCELPSSVSLSRRLNFRAGIRRADAVIVQTNDQKKRLSKNLGIDSKVIRTGLPVPRTRARPSDLPYALWVGRLIPVKRPEMYLDLAESMPDLRFVMIGTAYPGDLLGTRVLSRVKHIANLKYLGFVPYYETEKWLAKTSVVVPPQNTRDFPSPSFRHG